MDSAQSRVTRAIKFLLVLIVLLVAVLTVLLVILRGINIQRASAERLHWELNFQVIGDDMRAQANGLRSLLNAKLEDKEAFRHTYIGFRQLSSERLEDVYGREVADYDLWFEEFGHPILAYDDEYFISFHIELTGSVDVAYYYYSFTGDEPQEDALPLGGNWFLVYNRQW